MTKVYYTNRARLDLADLSEYIARDSPSNAEAFISKLMKKAERIALAPRIYRRRDDLAEDMRSAAFGNHLIFFRVSEEGIEILRIVHGGRDLPRLFEK
ncbi:MAG: type II toxin-antitoxin system RelE/ParE family toxin [Rhizomicrobium sp.]